MKTKQNTLSSTRIKRLRAQGYTRQSEAELAGLAYGNRFAYRLCTAILILGVMMEDIPVLALCIFFSALGIILPNHPFDYIYNHLLSEIRQQPKLPPRQGQLRFSCFIATLWIGLIIYMLYAGMLIAGYIMGGLLISVGILASTTDLCIPSLIYNSCFGKRTKN